MKTKQARALIKMLLPTEIHAAIDKAHNAPEMERVLDTFILAGAYVRRLRDEAEATPTAGPAPTPSTQAGLVITRVGNNKIGVIKAVRNITHLGLREAKDLVDRAEMHNTVIGVFSGEALSLAKRELAEAGCTTTEDPIK